MDLGKQEGECYGRNSVRKDMGVGSPMMYIFGHRLCQSGWGETMGEREVENNVWKIAHSWINAK